MAAIVGQNTKNWKLLGLMVMERGSNLRATSITVAFGGTIRTLSLSLSLLPIITEF